MIGSIFPVRLLHSLLSAGFKRRTKRPTNPIPASLVSLVACIPFPKLFSEPGHGEVRDHRRTRLPESITPPPSRHQQTTPSGTLCPRSADRPAGTGRGHGFVGRIRSHGVRKDAIHCRFAWDNVRCGDFAPKLRFSLRNGVFSLWLNSRFPEGIIQELCHRCTHTQIHKLNAATGRSETSAAPRGT
jgi:hypothetical protein